MPQGCRKSELSAALLPRSGTVSPRRKLPRVARGGALLADEVVGPRGVRRELDERLGHSGTGLGVLVRQVQPNLEDRAGVALRDVRDTRHGRVPHLRRRSRADTSRQNL